MSDSTGRFFRERALCLPIAFLCFAAVALFPAVGSAHTAPEAAVQAQEMLGSGIWSQVVELTNTNEKSRYPSTLYATVFEFDNTLWFYTSTGTQPIRRSKNRVDDFRQNLLPLLRDIERGFASMKLVPPAAEGASEFPHLENGCVIESIFKLEQLRQNGEQVEKAKLLLYSGTRNTRRGVGGNARGHAVLVFETPSGRFFVDPPKIQVVKPLEAGAEWDPVEFAAAIEAPYGKMEIREAFFVPVEGAASPVAPAAPAQLYSGDE